MLVGIINGVGVVIDKIHGYDHEYIYNYITYNAIIAITIDPLDINKLGNDKELQLLLE